MSVESFTIFDILTDLPDDSPIFQIIAGSMTAFVSSFFQAGIEVSLKCEFTDDD